jgi:hypothetical protein
MPPTVITTLLMIAFSVGVTLLALYGWFGNWDPINRRPSPAKVLERDYQAGVQEIRQAIREYEQGRRTL